MQKQSPPMPVEPGSTTHCTAIAATAASMLAKAGVDLQALECGAHWPYHDGALKALAAAPL